MPRILLPATLEGMSEANAFLEASLDTEECPPRARMALTTALEEIFMNIVHYSGAASAELSLERDSDTMEMRFTDAGVPFNPLDRAEPDLSLPVEERPIGGLGILMVRRLMDDVAYTRENYRNILTVRKKLI